MQNKVFISKIADSDEELRQIHELNYETFVEEIPQHPKNNQGNLVDKFHRKNIYCIVKQGHEVVGMVSICSQRPFSLDQKLPNLNEFLPKNSKVAEVRLLSIKKRYRRGTVFKRLIKVLFEYIENNGYDILIASGTLREIKLYQHIGFVFFGPVVGSKEAPYQPMYLEVVKAVDWAKKIFKNGTPQN